MPKWTRHPESHDATRQEVIDACLQIDRARYDELGRTIAPDDVSPRASRSSAREQPAAPISLANVDE